MALGPFTCNICSAKNDSPEASPDREISTCLECRSSMRFRAIVLALSRALFGQDLKLSEFPKLKSVRGLGISDSDIYAPRLNKLFSYTNTYLQRDPTFDLTRPDEAKFGRHDFVLCSEVLEHVPSPVERSFQTLARLLKPHGVLIVTAPYSLEEATVEHFPNLGEYGLAEVQGRTVLVNRSAEGKYEVFENLVFHGGEGSTLEMREFSESELRRQLEAAGLPNVLVDSTGNREFGVVYTEPCSLPITASQYPFMLGRDGLREMTTQLAAARRILGDVRESRWTRLGRRFGVGPRLHS